ncbi:MAG TPA: META domain-containing protein [Jiangellaceae bacterium]|nr:META domain-containing protein [Jiangellaceae bacterium]
MVALLSACGSTSADDESASTESGPGAATTGGPAEQTGPPVVGTTWAITRTGVAEATSEVPADAQAYVLIDEAGKVIGSTGCNGFGGEATVSADGTTISFGPLMSTKIACSGDLGTMDAAVLGVLTGAVTVEQSGAVMTLTTTTGESLVLTADDTAPES